MNALSRNLLKVRWMIRYHGLPATGAAVSLKLWKLVTRRDLTQEDWFEDYLDRCFDRRFGLDTGGKVRPDEMNMSEKSRKAANMYQASLPHMFALMLTNLGIDHRHYIFIDFGSGKGRTLAMASEFSFKKVIGVEYARELHEVAVQNLARLRAKKPPCGELLSVCADAATYLLPNEPAVLYFFHPFRDAALYEAVLANLRRSVEAHPRHMLVVYQNAVYRSVFDRAGFLEPKAIAGLEPSWWAVYEACADRAE